MFPARVGMNRCNALLALFWLGVPRASGDEPWTSSGITIRWKVFPARVGMNRAVGL
ncbi:hypothetical protein NSPZN2_50197 [Nitrospira defluvii]|uniref:Uncharacterized protein n=1 Tax=Nitrospira defluvii TaxID=330214 RepID=A0ABM8S3V2_9BACT|nr:hypothetical protein NSPZN2_50197 [Nitrospira defluvii]